MTSTPNRSLWLATAPDDPGAPLDRSVDVDAVVVGAGITGLLVALQLQRSGAVVAVVDRSAIGAGVTANTTAKVTALHGSAYSELTAGRGAEVAAAYGAANLAGLAHLRAVVDELAIDCDATTALAASYATTDDGLETLAAELEAARAAGLDVRFDSETELPFPVTGAVVLDDQFHLHPRRLCLELAAALVDGHLFPHTAVHGLSTDGDRQVVEADGATITADHVVLATHAPIRDLGTITARMEPTRSYAVSVDAGDAAPTGMYLSVDEPSRSIRPARDGDRTVLVIGGEGHPVGAPEATDARFEALEGWAADVLGAGAPRHRWSAHDHTTSDGVPFIGRFPGPGGRWVATGFRKWGFTNAAAAALALGELVADRPPPDWWAPFDSTRVAPTLSRALVGDAARAARNLVGERVRLKTRKGAALAELSPGEGVVVDEGDGPVAASMDDDGTVTVVSAACTHLGCVVAWNGAERSWDCPCHASRFDPTGAVLAGPATEALTPIAPAGAAPAPAPATQATPDPPSRRRR